MTTARETTPAPMLDALPELSRQLDAAGVPEGDLNARVMKLLAVYRAARDVVGDSQCECNAASGCPWGKLRAALETA